MPDDSTVMKVALYARVSTEEQTEENQVAILEKWAADRGWEVHDRYCDVGSAWQHSDQKELRRLLTDCDRGVVKLVLVYDLSRLTRKGPLDMMLSLKRFADKGVQVYSYLETWINVPSEFQQVMVAFYGYFAELYSRQLSERTKAGMRRAKGQGTHVGRPRSHRRAVKLTDIYSQSETILGSRFYALRFDPDVYPCRVKFGITRNMARRLEQYRYQHPSCSLIGSWSCPNRWEREAIAYVTSELNALAVAGQELFEVSQWQEIAGVLHNWFLTRYLSSEKGGAVSPAFSGMEAC